jgi:two-component system, OmpR family, sensor kinase
VEGDPDRIAQVVRNIARNAVEHTRSDGLVRLTATAHGDLLTIGIEDDGPGIAVDQRDYVFDRFHRADSSRSRSRGGSGLGLAIARAIVLEHGGRIWAERAPAGGAARRGRALEVHLHARRSRKSVR